jgi:hypothetical protein
MKIKPQFTIIISVCIVLTGIAFTYLLGLWTTQTTKVPKKLEQDEYSDQYDPSDIRGSYTFSEISNLFNIPIEDLAAAFMVEEDAAAEFKCKELEQIYTDTLNEIGTGSVKMFVAFYLGLPYELTEDTYLPDSAAQILKQKSNITPEQLTYLETHITAVS